MDDVLPEFILTKNGSARPVPIVDTAVPDTVTNVT